MDDKQERMRALALEIQNTAKIAVASKEEANALSLKIIMAALSLAALVLESEP